MKELWQKKIVKIGTFVIGIAVILIIAGITVQGVREKQMISAHVEAAQKYLSELDYEQAIAEYIAALEIAPNDQALLDALEQAYLEMAQLQVEKEQYSEAIDILDRGYEEIQRIVLLEKKDEVEQLQAQKAEEERLAKEARRLEEEKKKEEEARRAEEEKRREEDARREEEEEWQAEKELEEKEERTQEEELESEAQFSESTGEQNSDGTMDVYSYIGNWEEFAAVSEGKGMSGNCDENGFYNYCTDKFDWYAFGTETNSFDIENRGNLSFSFRGIRVGSNITEALSLVSELEAWAKVKDLQWDWYYWNSGFGWSFYMLVNETGVVTSWSVVGDEVLE